MTKSIFKSICIVTFSVFFASVILFMGALYTYFSNVQRTQLKMQTDLAAQGVNNEGDKYFDGLKVNDYRITWIDSGGKVLYDSRSDYSEMENHLEREEIKEAFETGFGESARFSATMMERSIYCAKLLPDNTVLRLSIAQNTLFTLLIGMLQPICIIFVAALALALILASRLSKGIVRPLNELNLDEPLNNDVYDELSPLLGRIAAQQRQIRDQMEELSRKRSEFEAITTGMAEGIVLLNDKRVIVGINPAAARLFGTDSSCVGKYLTLLNRSFELQELLQKAGDGKHAEMIMDLNGSLYQFDASPIFSDGFVSGAALLTRDVTEKEKAEQIRREFTANVSHELKTPLQAISGSAELMVNGMVKKEDIPEFSRRIYAEAQRMISLVEDIIKLSHLDEGANDMKRENTDLYALGAEVVRSLRPQAEAAGVKISLNGGTAMVYGVKQLLHGIIYNLCDNAIKYNRRDGSVTVTIQNEGNSPTLTVADTGIGIPPEHQERVFERFYRVDKSHSKEIGGTGLGLSIVKHAAKLHNAKIELNSAAGGGTTIKVSFPGA